MAARFDLRKLMSACIHLSRRAGCVIREEHGRGQLGAHNKKLMGDERSIVAMPANEVLTIADTRAQDAIVTSLRCMFPRLRIVGEEGDVKGKENPTPMEDVPLIDHDFHTPGDLEESFTEADTCLWIDPLDGTKEFVLGRLENVSVLIGIAVRDRPIGGVMFQPFVGGDRGLLTYGAVGVGVFGDRDPPFGDAPQERVLVTNQKTLDDPRMQLAIARLSPRPRVVTMSACGNKLLRVLRGEASAFVIGPGPSRWDTCAGEGLLLALGGKASDLDGHLYQYVENETYDNAAGLIAARTEELHSWVLEAFTDGIDDNGEPSAKKQRS